MNFKYKLVRSKRKTLTLCITGGELTVKAPQRTTVEHIESFIAQKSAWIEKKLSEYGKKTDALSPALDGTHILYHGEFKLIERSNSVKRVAISGASVLVPVKYDTREAQERAVTAFIKRIAAKELAEVLAVRAQGTGLKYGDFATTNARTKWGSCDGNGNIRLNWRLVMLDDKLVDYVVMHELCHTLHHDHSAAFWSEVEKRCPTFKLERKRLKAYSVLTSMYR